MIELRDYQTLTLAKVRASYRAGCRAPLLVAPTGSGKTTIFCHVADQAARKGNQTLILAHRAELIRQTAETLDRFGVEYGLIIPGATLTDAPVQVASVQTLTRRLTRLAWQPDLIVVDEAHHCTRQTGHGRILAHFSTAKVLGCTATPERLDGQGLGVGVGGFFDALIQGPSVRDLVDSGHLSRPVVFAPPDRPDLSGIRTAMGDYDRGALAETMDKPRITGDAIEHYRRLVAGAQSIAFCVSVAHAEHVAEAFRLAGYQAASIDGTLSDKDRRQRIADLGAGKLNAITSCELVGEGVDVPIVGGCLLLRPTQSTSLFLQQIGRTLRPYPGKEKAIIIDAVGNVLRHGHPLEDREWSLDSKPRRQRKGEQEDKGQEKVRVCPECAAIHPLAPACPECGYQYPNARHIEVVHGHLTEVKPEDRRLAAKREQSRCRTLEDLQDLAARYGYRAGWAEHVWRSRQARQHHWQGQR